MENKKMYTEDGQLVSNVIIIENGFLGTYSYEEWNEDDECMLYEFDSEDIIFFKKLHEKPPVQKYYDEVNKLTKQIDSLKNDIKQLEEIKRKENYILKNTIKYPILQLVSDYLSDNYKYVLYYNSLEIKQSSQVYKGSVRTGILYGKIPLLYASKNDGYISSEDCPFLIFKTKEEAVEKCKNFLIEKINNYTPGSYADKVSAFKSFYLNLNNSCEVKKEKDIIELYEEKIKSLENIEKETKQKNILKELEDLDKKTKLLKEKLDK